MSTNANSHSIGGFVEFGKKCTDDKCFNASSFELIEINIEATNVTDGFSSWMDEDLVCLFDFLDKEDQMEKYVQKMRGMDQIKAYNWNPKKYKRINKMKRKRKRKR